MKPHRCPYRLLVAALWWSLAATSSAQSLADAARRAEEQRLQSPADTPSFSDRDLVAGGNREALNLALTMPLLQQYSNARASLLRAMVRSPDLARQVVGAMGRAGRRGVDGLENEYTLIPPVVDAIRSAQMDAHSYVVTETAFMIAVGVLAGKLSVLDTASAAIATNVAFVRSHQQEIALLLKEATSLENELRTSQTARQLPP
jgi:hypothetical protein